MKFVEAGAVPDKKYVEMEHPGMAEMHSTQKAEMIDDWVVESESGLASHRLRYGIHLRAALYCQYVIAPNYDCPSAELSQYETVPNCDCPCVEESLECPVQIPRLLASCPTFVPIYTRLHLYHLIDHRVNRESRTWMRVLRALVPLALTTSTRVPV